MTNPQKILTVSFTHLSIVMALACLLAFGHAMAQPRPLSNPYDYYPPDEVGEANDGLAKEEPKIENLGGEVYRIGNIKVDKSKREFSIPGIMLPYEGGKPIEFFATMKQGFKAYESVLSLQVNAFEFNLACILIGLEGDDTVKPEYHFDPREIEGDPVSLQIRWQKDGRTVEQDAIEILKVADKKPSTPSNWVYTGSTFVEGNRYLAQMDGVLVGMIHTPASIIEHKEGMGLGAWGAIAIDDKNAPASGQAVTLVVRSLK